MPSASCEETKEKGKRMPPIEVIASPVRDRISIPIPKKYRAYSFVVTLTPVAEASDNRHRDTRRGKGLSAFELMHCPIPDEGEELDVRRNPLDCGREIDL